MNVNGLTVETRSYAGIEFPANAPEFDKRPLHLKVYDFILSLLREIKPALLELGNTIAEFFNSTLHQCDTSTSITWKEESEGLYLMIHGLGGDPMIWNAHFAKIQKEHPECDIRAPKVPNRADCSIAEAARPFFRMVTSYMARNPGKPITLIGFSRGCQIAAYIETEARKMHNAQNIHLSLVSGPLLGTEMVDMLEDIGIEGLYMQPDTSKELRFGAVCSLDIVRDMREQPKAEHKRTYQLYSSIHDGSVLPFASALPNISEMAQYHLYSGYGHNGIRDAIMEEQIKECISWMQGAATTQ